ncbi:MAG: hypothetical protein WD988_01310 [Candidatus Curtissbacteria bacterium]
MSETTEISTTRTSAKSMPGSTEARTASEHFPGRRAFIKLLLTGGAVAALSACGVLTPEEKKDIPYVDLKDLIAHPDLYTKHPLIKTTGYPQQAGTRTTKREELYGGVALRITSSEQAFYKLHQEPEVNSPSIEYTMDDDFYKGHVAWIGPPKENSDGSHIVSAEKYQITGHLQRILESDGKTEKYVFRMYTWPAYPHKIVPKDPATPVPATGK